MGFIWVDFINSVWWRLLLSPTDSFSLSSLIFQVLNILMSHLLQRTVFTSLEALQTRMPRRLSLWYHTVKDSCIWAFKWCQSATGYPTTVPLQRSTLHIRWTLYFTWSYIYRCPLFSLLPLLLEGAFPSKFMCIKLLLQSLYLRNPNQDIIIATISYSRLNLLQELYQCKGKNENIHMYNFRYLEAAACLILF